MLDWPILSLVTFLPVLGALFILLIRGEEEVVARNARFVALWTTVITFAISLLLWTNFDYTTADFQFVEKQEWLGVASYHLGVDGISILFVMLTTFLMPLVILSTWEMTDRAKDYMIAFLVLEGLMIGVFVALGLVAGAAIGAARIYGSGGASVHAGQAANAQCTATAAYQTAIDPLLAGDMAAMAIRDEPENLSSLAFNDNAGTPITLADTGEKLRLINLWATWCAPCREEMPWLETLQQERGGEGFEVVAISVDGGSDDKPRAFLDEIGVSNLGLYRDASMGVFNTLKKEGLAFGLPVTLMIGKDGCMLGAMNGPAEWASKDAKALSGALKGI